MDSPDLWNLLQAMEPPPPPPPPADGATIALVERELGVQLPDHYRAFLTLANGCEGALGEGYIALWRCEQLAELNRGYELPDVVPGLLAIGSDGGGTAVALDLAEEGSPVVTVPFIGAERSEVTRIGADIRELLLAVAAGEDL